eukprot:401938_1
MPDGSTRLKVNGKQLQTFIGTSTFSQYTVLPEVSVAKINQRVLSNNKLASEACLLACGVTTGVGSARTVMNVERGSSVAVFGLGGIGLSVVQGCKLNGAKRIIAIDINPNKFNIAKKLGATECINPLDYKEKKIEHVIIKKTGGG